MVARGQFRHHAAIGLVHCDLAMQAMGQQAPLGVIDGDRRFVAGAFNSYNTHKPCKIAFQPLLDPNTGAPFAFCGGAP